MKFYALLLIFSIAVCKASDSLKLNEETHQRLQKAGKACIEQVGLSQEAVQQLRNGNFANADQKSKCFVNCFLEKLQVLQNGVPQENAIRQQLNAIVGEEKTNSVVQQCNGLRGADNCETGFKLYECYYRNKAASLA